MLTGRTRSHTNNSTTEIHCSQVQQWAAHRPLLKKNDTSLFWFFPRSNKPGSSPNGQTKDESNRRTDANSSVSDLANSVTSDMLMVM